MGKEVVEDTIMEQVGGRRNSSSVAAKPRRAHTQIQHC